MRFARDNGLSLGFGMLFLVSLILQAISGHDTHGHDQRCTRAIRSASATT